MAENITLSQENQEILQWNTTMFEREGTVGCKSKFLDAYAHFVQSKLSPTLEGPHTALGLCGEAGEYADAVKKAFVYGQQPNMDNLLEELGDVAFYLQAACNYWGFTLEDVLTQNVIKLSQRYKAGFTTQESIDRADKQEQKDGDAHGL